MPIEEESPVVEPELDFAFQWYEEMSYVFKKLAPSSNTDPPNHRLPISFSLAYFAIVIPKSSKTGISMKIQKKQFEYLEAWKETCLFP